MYQDSNQFKSMRSLKRKIIECDEAIKGAEDLKKQKIELEKQLKEMEIDLVRDKKIKWVEMSFQNWVEETTYKTFYIWYLGNKYEYGVWEGEDKLNEDEHEHFKIFYKHYFYHGGVMSSDYCAIVDPYSYPIEMSEMDHAFEDGDARISEVYRDDLSL